MSLKIDNQTFFNQHQASSWNRPPIVVAWKLSSAENLGALLRVCDNFGVQEVFFVGNDKHYKYSKIKRNATTSYKKIAWSFISETELWNVLPSKILTIAVDTTSVSKEVNQYNFEDMKNSFCLFFGNETVGLEDSVIQKCDESIHIPMVGESYSMNVVNAASVVLYEAAKQCLLNKK
jgi:tRNA G18 (ribose-2'-O)-methylase SpoU